MICVSIAQTSHRMALADMLNASRLCDLIEMRLDRFEKPPVISTLKESSHLPIIISCRRPRDGGDWPGTEAARLALLRQAVLDNVDYVEIELDCADQIRRYGQTKRVIAYTNTFEVPENLDEIYQEACSNDPDVIKLTVPTRTPIEAWPLIKIVARGRTPTVAVGWGRSNLMLNVLGRRYKAPWTYAALEKGMEAYPGMATISELADIYDYKHIDGKTPLVAITGFSEEQLATARVLNHGFRLAGHSMRCLPIEMGSVDLFAKIARAIKLAGVIVDERHREQVLDVVTKRSESVELAQASDFIAIDNDQWLAFNLLSHAVVGAMEEAMRTQHPGERPLEGRTVLMIGAGGSARGIAATIQRHGGLVIIADRDNELAHRLASGLSARCIAASQIYTTVCDGIVLCRSDADGESASAIASLVKGLAREGLLGVDLTRFPRSTAFLNDVRDLGGIPVSPVDVLVRMMQSVLKIYTKHVFPLEQLAEPLRDLDLGNDSGGG